MKPEVAPGVRRLTEIQIGSRSVGDGHPCYVIAEIGSNHNHELALAQQLIEAAAEAGVDAVKFQTFRAKHHYSRKTPGFTYLGGQDTFSLIESLELNRDWHALLKEHAEAQGVHFLSSPCDPDAVRVLSELDVLANKVSSFDLPDLELIQLIAETQKPIILSTGMADWMDIQRGVETCRKAGNENIVLLQCTSLYPAPPELSNLHAMHSMRSAFGALVGYSDHTRGDHIPIAAAALGAHVIEKHFTLDRSLPGPDHPFAIEPDELRVMMQRLRDVEAALGDGAKAGPREAEQEMYEKGRRSLHAKTTIAEGTKITADMLCTKRPGYGIPPHLKVQLVGRTAKTDIEADHWVTWDMV